MQNSHESNSSNLRTRQSREELLSDFFLVIASQSLYATLSCWQARSNEKVIERSSWKLNQGMVAVMADVETCNILETVTKLWWGATLTSSLSQPTHGTLRWCKQHYFRLISRSAEINKHVPLYQLLVYTLYTIQLLPRSSFSSEFQFALKHSLTLWT